MSNLNLRTITNSFQDCRLVSLASWRQAAEFSPRDRGGPYVVMQEGYDPDDLRMIPEEFVLGRSGKWMSLAMFYRMPIEDRRAEYIFGTAAEVMQMMSNLPSKATLLRSGSPTDEAAGAPAEADEMATAFEAARGKSSGTTK
jgi:hypothetical protein